MASDPLGKDRVGNVRIDHAIYSFDVGSGEESFNDTALRAQIGLWRSVL
jgi:hypothetical protein